MKQMKLLLVMLLLGVTSLYAQSAKVVYDLTTGDSAKIEKVLIGGVTALSKYYTEENIDFKVIVVISGDAYKYFVEDLKNSPYSGDAKVFEAQKNLKTKLATLNKDKGVTFTMCATGMKARKIQKETLYKYVEAELMKGVYLIGAQNDGYAYMPIH